MKNLVLFFVIMVTIFFRIF